MTTVTTASRFELSELQFQRTGLASDFASEARLGIYVHVPFCPHICPYCDFVKTAQFKNKDVKTFFAELEQQFEELSKFVPSSVKTVTLYFGGGTPSLFSAHFYAPLVEKIKSRFSISEFTIETNPYTNAKTGFRAFADMGVNRVTLGAQSLSQTVLNYLGRKHTPAQILDNLKFAHEAGIHEVQVDLIFGLRQLAEKRNIVQEARRLAEAGASGVSCYLLTIEQSTAFKSETTALDEDIVAEYESLLQACDGLGFTQFETSNFSKTAPIHNRLYWYGLPYLGLGTGAHGLLPATPDAPFGRRYSVGRLTNAARTGDDALPFSRESERLFDLCWDEEVRTLECYREELILTLLRTQRGVPLPWFNEVFSDECRARFWQSELIQRALHDGLLGKNETHLSVSPIEKIRGDSWSLSILTELHR